MIDPSVDSKALLAIVIAFGKSNSHVLDLLQLRKSSALVERTVVNQALQLALEQHQDAFESANALVKDLPRLGKTAQRLLTKLKEVKATNSRTAR